jgi:hypothetical protein
VCYAAAPTGGHASASSAREANPANEVTMSLPPVFRHTLSALTLPILLLATLPADQARAEGECVAGGGTAAGDCPTSGVGPAGCCSGTQVVQWCSSGVLCEKNCRQVYGTTAPYCGLFDGFIDCVETQEEAGGRACPGSSGGGGGSACGTCGPNQTCNESTGQCEAANTGSSCGTCGPNQTCNQSTGQCESTNTGSACGACGPNQRCNESTGQCESTDPGCTPQCAGKTCGDDGCGGTCGTCQNGQSCENGSCVGGGGGPCTPTCNNRNCGDDGCGGVCGTCPDGQSCSGGGVCGFGSSTADPAPGGDTSAVPPQECPAGQYWNQVAGACVLLGSDTTGSGSDDGGCGGGAASGLLGLGAGLLALARRRFSARC